MSKELDEFNAKLNDDKELEKAIELDRRKTALQEKDLFVKEHRIGNQYDTIVKNKDEIDRAPAINFGSLSNEAIERMVVENEEYIMAARNPMPFINEDFKGIVPFFRNNLIFIGSKTGGGKSTAVANIAYSLLKTKNKTTNKPYRVLLLTNEEKNTDFYNRITSLLKKTAYTNHSDFTDAQMKEFGAYIRLLGKSGKLTVIEDTHEGISGWTTTPQGISLIFDNLLKNNDIYDLVIIDYYQNINTSKIDPSLAPWQVQEQFANDMDRYKLKYPGAIVVMGQMDALRDDDDTTPYKVRVNGRKSICDKCTFICEITPETNLLRSKWAVWKSRWTTSIGQTFYSGYDRGMLVPYSVEFQKNTAKLVERNLERAKERELGLETNKEENSDKIDDS
jgi:hypothetical protein